MGLFGSIGKLIGKVAKPVLKMSPVGQVGLTLAKSARGAMAKIGRKLGRKGRKAVVAAGKFAGGAVAYEGVSRAVDRAMKGRGGPGGTISGLEGTKRARGGGGGMRSYRRMNPGNAKALRRAIRRVDRFKKLARAVGFSRPPAKIRGVHTVKGM